MVRPEPLLKSGETVPRSMSTLPFSTMWKAEERAIRYWCATCLQAPGAYCRTKSGDFTYTSHAPRLRSALTGNDMFVIREEPW